MSHSATWALYDIVTKLLLKDQNYWLSHSDLACTGMFTGSPDEHHRPGMGQGINVTFEKADNTPQNNLQRTLKV